MHFTFRKSDPKTKVLMPDGSWLEFSRVDSATGIYHTQDPKVAESLRILMRKGQGGVDEISEDEFHALLKKKESQTSTRVWREEWQPQAQIQDHLNAKVPMEVLPGAAGNAAANSFQKAVSSPPLPQTVERPKATKRE